MEKERLKFLEKNIQAVKKYKQNGYDKYEKQEIQATKEVLDEYYTIVKKIKTTKEKKIFKNFFITKLNKAFNGGFSPTDKRNLLKILNQINLNLKNPNYKITKKSLEKNLKEIITKSYSTKLNKLQKEILEKSPAGSINYMINKNFDKLNIEKKEKIILSLLKSPLVINNIKNVINHLIGKSIVIKIKRKYYKINFTKDFVEENKKELFYNFRKIVFLFLLLESTLNLTAKHSKSSAKGIGQWLTNNGFFDKKHIRHSSSFETALNYAARLGFKIKGIQYPIRRKIKILPQQLSITDQLNLVIYTIYGRNKKYFGNSKYLILALLGNERAIKMLYTAYVGRKGKHKGLSSLTKKEIYNIKRKFKKHYFKIYNPETKKWE